MLISIGSIAVSFAALVVVLLVYLRRARRRFAAADRALRERDAENQALAGRLIVAQEAERRRIARDLHDDLSQKLALLNVEIDLLATQGIVDWHRREQRFRRLSRAVAEITSDVHDLSHELHPSKLRPLGLVTALDALCRDLSCKYGIIIDFHHIGGPVTHDADVCLHLYRIVQEGLHNVVKHSAATHAIVEVEVGSAALDLRIADQGRGFVPTAAAREGIGLVSMRERARIVGGQMIIHTKPAGGTRLGIRVPIVAERSREQGARVVSIRSAMHT
jgi:signal transduction histidine kinase